MAKKYVSNPEIRKALEAALRDYDSDMPKKEVKELAHFFAFAAEAILNGQPGQKKEKSQK